jgi:hypothetical protein
MNLDLDTLLKFIKDYPAISSLIATGVNILIFIAGLVSGHRLAIGRDKRKEYNDSVLPIHTKLINQLENLKQKKYKPDHLNRDELIGFSIYLTVKIKWGGGYKSPHLPTTIVSYVLQTT